MQNLVSSSTRTSVTNVPVQYYKVSLFSLSESSIRKTWLQSVKEHLDWQNNQGQESGFLTPISNEGNFLDKNKTHESWLQNEDGESDFNTEGEETYID